jgi:hypothetical protein
MEEEFRLRIGRGVGGEMGVESMAEDRHEVGRDEVEDGVEDEAEDWLSREEEGGEGCGL